MRALQTLLKLLLYILALPAVLVIRMIRPLLLERWGGLISTRIGHFAANTEMYLCERDAGINVPKQRHVDIFYMESSICNQQLAIIWKRMTPRNAGEPLDLLTNGLHKVADRRGRQDDESCVWAGAPTQTG